MPTLERTLEELGLSDKEAKIYLASLELGPSAVQKIAETADINRVTTYVILGNLTKRGLITTIEKGKKTLFTAEDPESLESLLNKVQNEIDEKKELLKDIMPELFAVMSVAGKKPIVRVLEGKEGLTSLQSDYLKSSKKGDEICSFVPIDNLYKVFPLKNDTNTQARIKKRIKKRIIYTTTANNHIADNGQSLTKACFVPSEKFPFTSGIDIYGDNKVAITNYKDKLMGIVIESKELHDSFKIIFELAWEGAKKYCK